MKTFYSSLGHVRLATRIERSEIPWYQEIIVWIVGGGCATIAAIVCLIAKVS